MMWTTQPRSRVGDVAFIRAGTGSRVLLVHGVGLRGESFAAQIEALSANHEVIAIDLPGHGESAECRAENVAQLADSLEPLLDQPFALIGHSLGALIALELACRNHPNLRAIAPLNAIYERDAAASAAVQARARELAKGEVSNDVTLDRWYGDRHPELRKVTDQWLRQCPQDGYARAYRIFAHYQDPPRQKISEISCPALFITGDKDPNSTVEMSEKLSQLPMHARAHIIFDAAHMAHMTHAESVNDALLAFLAGCDYGD